MSYVDSNLLPGEKVTFRTRLHPIIFATPVALALFAVFLYVFGVSSEAHGLGNLILLAALVVGAAKYLDFVTSEFAVTDKRVIIKVGFVRRRTLELQLQKVETVGVDQGIGGRIFGYGNITVTGTGGTKEPFKRVAAPLDLRRAVQAGSS